VDRTTLNGLAGWCGSGTKGTGFSDVIGAGVPSLNVNRPTPPWNIRMLSTCSNVDQIHCGLGGVLRTMCSPTRPTVVAEHLPVSGSLTIAERLVEPALIGVKALQLEPGCLDRDRTVGELHHGEIRSRAGTCGRLLRR
jgi:hypothetical protein